MFTRGFGGYQVEGGFEEQEATDCHVGEFWVL